MRDRRGSEIRPGDRVLVPCAVRGRVGASVALLTEEAADPRSDDPDERRGTALLVRPRQVELAVDATPVRHADLDVEALVGACRRLVASAGLVMAGRVTVADDPLRWVEAALERADAAASWRGVLPCP